MDANKLETLRTMKYQIRRCCSNCIYSRLGRGADWGTCNEFEYQHRKHSETTRQVSIHANGYCASHEFIQSLLRQVEHFKEFLEK